MKRTDADRYDYEILGSAPSWISDAEQYDLVEVDAEPVSASERRLD